MLFNTLGFIFVFLPVTLAGFFLLGRVHQTLARVWLASASLAFYGWWNPTYVVLLAGSIGVNYVMAASITRARAAGRQARARALLTLAVAANLVLLGWFKYAAFFVANLNAVAGAHWVIPRVVLPLGISFFTFTQIAYLVDLSRDEPVRYPFVDYVLFVTYFPHLIAGPILHHREMMPQFRNEGTFRFRADRASVGLTVFAIGLFKKVILADGVSRFVAPVFDTQAVQHLTLPDAWGGALAYTLQLYFDFSAYCDMAIGASTMLGMSIPLNFFSPYQATSIIEFWRRWHMTLSRFLRDYLYFPLGGNRHGTARRYINLMLTMVIGGLWHGAAWTFVAWGALHGAYLCVNHAWRALRTAVSGATTPSAGGRVIAQTLTLLAVVAGWVVFRAPDFASARAVLMSMAGLRGAATGSAVGFSWPAVYGWIVALMAIALVAPNTQQIMAGRRPALADEAYSGQAASAWLRWSPNAAAALLVAALFVIAVLNLNQRSPFLYFQF
ncbi:MAG: MBOAT family protein [Acidobacteriia bacterium]|nr:MBOAT family protein [Terriglobia bacterium]